jgi:D-amino peptidase
MGMKILISADIEGVTGITGGSFLNTSSQEYQDARLLMTEEINVVANCCFNNGVEEVYLVDAHGSGKNVLPELLNSKINFVNKHKRRTSMLEGIEQVDYCIFLGYHGKANQHYSYCAHTNSTKLISGVFINNVEFGESGLNVLVAKDNGVKLIFLSGTNNAVEEIKQLIPNLPTVTTKVSLSQHQSQLKDKDVVFNEIKESLASTLKNVDTINRADFKAQIFHWKVLVPYAYLLEDVDSHIDLHLDSVKHNNSNPREVTFSSSNIAEGYKKYQQLLSLFSKNYNKINN